VATKIGRNFPLNKELFAEKVLGGWLGKSIGGTLGAPYEGKKEILNLSFYDPVPEGSVPNDDLDLQLVWLHVLQDKGLNLDVNDLAEAWLDHIIYPFDEYGVAISNLKRGLRPPITGYHNNFFHDGLGAPIRSEIWAFISPAQPLKAMEYAYQDAVVDHAFDGVYGEVFLAVIESMAFVENRAEVLIDYGLSAIPENSRVARAVRDTVKWYHQGFSWLEIRERILLHHGSNNFTDCPQNIAFVILGWLCGGGDFEKSITTAVNCGYDADCTGATLGAILGVICGARGIPQKWLAPIGAEVVVGSGVVGIDAPKTLDDLSKLTCYFGEKSFTDNPQSVVAFEKIKNKALELAERYQPTYGIYRDGAKSVVIDYQGLPVSLSEKKSITISKLEGKLKGCVEVPFIPAVYWDLKFISVGKVLAQKPWLTEDGNLRLAEIEADEMVLETYLYFDGPSKLNLLVDINGEVEVRVNEKEVLSYHNHEPLLPAPHRCSLEDIASVNWQRGWNKFSIKIIKCSSECATDGWFLLAADDHHLYNNAIFPASRQEFCEVTRQYEIELGNASSL
jgi:ADP-ribosylglycohydrolase